MRELLALLLAIGGVANIVRGAISLFSKDAAWALTEWANRRRGLPSERSAEWERSEGVRGAVGVAIGAALLLFACLYLSLVPE